MNAKLTLRLDNRLINRARLYSSRSGKSLSQLVADFFALIETDEPVSGTELTPRVRALLGSLEGASVSEEDYRLHLEAKHR